MNAKDHYYSHTAIMERWNAEQRERRLAAYIYRNTPKGAGERALGWLLSVIVILAIYGACWI